MRCAAFIERLCHINELSSEVLSVSALLCLPLSAASDYVMFVSVYVYGHVCVCVCVYLCP